MHAQGSRSGASALRQLCLLLLGLSLCATASAQQLSIRHYGISEGLANSRVLAIHQDAKGYVWLATNEGLSRFDGYRFVNYSTRDGLGHSIINSITEDSKGHIWVATNGGGVSRLLDDPQESSRTSSRESSINRPKFVTFRIADTLASNRVNKLMFDATGNLWCGTDDGIYRAAADSRAAASPQFEPLPLNVGVAGSGGAGLADDQGRVWFSFGNGLVEVANDQIRCYSDGPLRHGASAMAKDGRGNVFAAAGGELFELVPASASTLGGWRKLPLNLKPGNSIVTMTADDEGTLWVGTYRGLVKYRDRQQSLYGSAQGLSDEYVRSLCQDRDGNLWIGTWDGGVCKLAGEMMISFGKREGIVNDVHKIIEGHDRRIIACLYPGGLAQFVEGKMVPIPRSRRAPFDRIGGRILESRSGEWWIATELEPHGGIFRFRESRLQLEHGERLLNIGEVGAGWFSAIYEDPEGTIWAAAGSNLYRFDRARRSPPYFERIALELPPAEHLQPSPPPGPHGVRSMISDGTGALWIGDLYMLAKYVDGKVRVLEPTDGLPETDPRAFFIDHRGWLWIGLRYRGVSMTTEPGAEHPHFVNYSTLNGLASDTVWCITEDDAGRMYFGTERGLDRLDIATGRIRHFTKSDGLAGDHVNSCMKDSRGYIWVTTTTGISRLDPRAERTSSQAPAVYLSRVQIAGEDLPMAETGASLLSQSDLPASRNNLLIQYTAIDFHDDHQLRYQYKLEGVDTDWGAPTEQMAVNYARLAPGAYRFLVRAINQDGIASLEPAVLNFRILSPLWLRWWFIAAIAMVAGLATYASYRYRVARLVEIERVRTRIASDLHDDIGANLSLIAGLSDMLRQQAWSSDQQVSERLSLIASVSRRSVDAMSDIVWAVNPNRDYVSDLTQRMRRFANDTLGSRGIDFRFESPGAEDDTRIGADVRREVFLIFKEAVNNLARHSKCSAASFSLESHSGMALLKISDNGKGFDVEAADWGQGLASMRKRAAKIGAELIVISSPGAGATLILKVPLR
jgi:ligand-binding sensor domain-containing protein/signal transduction histidine kinase